MFSTIGTGEWEPFGALHASTGPVLNLRFPGQWFGGESGLNQNWMRDYDPTTGLYIQGDPLGLVDGASVYGYAAQNPNRYVDPTGEFIPILFGLAAGAALLTPDPANAPGHCDEEIAPDPAAPYVNGALAGLGGLGLGNGILKLVLGLLNTALIVQLEMVLREQELK